MRKEQMIAQSKGAYNQWKEQWRKHAEIHKQFPMGSFEDFRNIGIGKAVVLVANGYSFEENIEILKKYKDNVDIMACDKTLGHLLDNGIVPTYCIVCDANVSYEKYLKKWKDQVSDTILFNNVCGNPEWSTGANWKKRYFYVNKDVMHYEREFMAISGCQNVVTAGTNVSNMMVVLLTQCDDVIKQNLFGYDKFLLLGFDYSWKEGGKYYSFDQYGNGKWYYMRHSYGVSDYGDYIYTSNNLTASAQWLRVYIQAFGLNVIQCSKSTMLLAGRPGDLEDHIVYKYKAEDSGRIRNILKERDSLEKRLHTLNNSVREIAKDHWFASNRI